MVRDMHCPKDPRIECLLPGPTTEGECCKYIPAGRPIGFGVNYRNPGHWDINTDYGRAFRIRGEDRNVLVLDEREDDNRPFPLREPIKFRSVALALAWCAEELMNITIKEGKNDKNN